MIDPLVAAGTLKVRNPIGEHVIGAGLPASHYLPCDGYSITTNPVAVAALGQIFPKATIVLRTTPTAYLASITSGSRIIAVGYNACAISDDAGSTWTAKPMPAAVNWRYLATSGSQVMSLSNSGDIAFSSDNGATWTAKTGVSGSFTGLLYTSGRWILLGDGSSYSCCWTSDNSGSSWTQRTISNASVMAFSAINTDGATLFASCDTSNFCATSVDNGTTWVARPLPTNSGGGTYIKYNGVHVLAGYACVAYSTDAVTWYQGVQVTGFFAQFTGKLLHISTAGSINDISSLTSSRAVASLSSGSVFKVISVGTYLAILSSNSLFVSGDGVRFVRRVTPLVINNSSPCVVVGSVLAYVNSSQSLTLSLDAGSVQAPDSGAVNLISNTVTPHLGYYLRIA